MRGSSIGSILKQIRHKPKSPNKITCRLLPKTKIIKSQESWGIPKYCRGDQIFFKASKEASHC